MTKILYVEDNDDNVFMLTHRLSRKGYEVVVAGDGEQGVARANEEKPALILMDLSLPVLDGWEATRRLKSDPATQNIPVIALSAHAMPGDAEKALDHLSRVLLAGFSHKEWVENDGDLTSLHGHPRFQELLDQMDGPR